MSNVYKTYHFHIQISYRAILMSYSAGLYIVSFINLSISGFPLVHPSTILYGSHSLHHNSSVKGLSQCKQFLFTLESLSEMFSLLNSVSIELFSFTLILFLFYLL